MAMVEIESVKCPIPSENRRPETKHSENGSTTVTPEKSIKMGTKKGKKIPGSIFILSLDQRTILLKKPRMVGLMRFCSAG